MDDEIDLSDITDIDTDADEAASSGADNINRGQLTLRGDNVNDSARITHINQPVFPSENFIASFVACDGNVYKEVQNMSGTVISDDGDADVQGTILIMFAIAPGISPLPTSIFLLYYMMNRNGH